MFSPRVFDIVGDLLLLGTNWLPSIQELCGSEIGILLRRVLFKFLYRKNLIDGVNKIFPSNEIGLIFTLKMIQNEFELIFRKGQLGHSQRFSKLVLSDVSVAKFIEIFHELGDTYPLLFDLPSQTIQEIFQIIRDVAFNRCS
jgi:hypothetical protein